MQLTVKYFGMLAEAAGRREEVLTVEKGSSTSQLVKKLHTQYDFLETMAYKVVVNQQILSNEVILDSDDEIVLLPPFAGG